MRLSGRLWHVVLVVCPLLMPARGEAAIISTPLGSVGAGSFNLSGTFTTDNDIALFSFTLSDAADITAQIDSHLEDPAGFDPVITLFGPGDGTDDFQGVFDFLSDSSDGLLGAALGPGDYLVAITQYNNFFVPDENRFDFDAAMDGLFTKMLFDQGDTLPCTQFVAFDFETSTPECRTGEFDGTLTVEPSNAVPEPGMLSLVTLGGAALIAQRRRRRRDES